jgi:spoIIIJ-associated protein
MTFREFTGKNVEEAIRSAMSEFSAELADLDIEILSAGSRGILGVGSEQARILAAPKSAVAAAETLRMPSEEAPPAADEAPVIGPSPGEEASEPVAADVVRRAARGGRGGRERRSRDGNGRRPPRDAADRPARAPREPSDRPAPAFIPAKPLEELNDEERKTLQDAKEVLEEVLRLMGLDASVEIAAGAETAKLNVSGDELGTLIGRRGERLASLQHVVNLIVARRSGRWHRIMVDVENYRGRREDLLRDVAARAARRVEETGKIIQLEPMPAIERRVVHLALVDNPKVRTQSVGEDPNRRIVVLPADQART